MPEAEKSYLRIYCVCGQKMKVSQTMLGRPGKCVACRQKMRIPTLDEIPEGVDEIYLKDHPEFLRKSKRRPRKGSSRDETPPRAEKEPTIEAESPPEPETPREKKKAKEESGELTEKAAIAVAERKKAAKKRERKRESGSGVPLDVLEPLRNLCSIQYKLRRQLKALREDEPEDETNRADLQGHLSRIQRVRADLDEQLRQILMEVAIELASTQEKIVENSLAARVGELPFGEFRQAIYRLRCRRDRLERRQHNLRGWLSTSDPHLTGGFIDLPLESIPDDGFSISIPSDSEETEPVINIHTAGLREALSRRAQAERRLSETERLGATGDLSGRRLRESTADTKAEIQIAEATATFYRGRLERLKTDSESDMETYAAQLDLARGRLQVGEIERSAFDILERQLLRAKTDTSKAKSLAKRALMSNSAQDVPRPRGTFLERLGMGEEESKTQIDVWLIWGAAAAFGFTIFLPLVGDMSLLSAYLKFNSRGNMVSWVFLLPIFSGMAVAIAGALPKGAVRSRVITCLWPLITLAAFWLIHEAQFSMDVMADLFRSVTPWALRPGLILAAAGNVALIAAAFIALAPTRPGRLWLGGSVALSVIGLVVIGTNVGGYLSPAPLVTVVEAGRFEEGRSEHSIRIRNDGNRAMYLVPQASTSRAAYLFLLEQRRGASSWKDVTPVDDFFARGWPGDGVLTVGAGKELEFVQGLSEGAYRVVLISERAGEELVLNFTVEGPIVAEPVPAVAKVEEELPEEAVEEGISEVGEEEEVLEDEVAFEIPVSPYPEVELRGILTSSEGRPKFSFRILYPDGSMDRVVLDIGEQLFGSWEVDSFNRGLNSVTIENGNDYLILRTGQATMLTSR